MKNLKIIIFFLISCQNQDKEDFDFLIGDWEVLRVEGNSYPDIIEKKIGKVTFGKVPDWLDSQSGSLSYYSLINSSSDQVEIFKLEKTMSYYYCSGILTLVEDSISAINGGGKRFSIMDPVGKKLLNHFRKKGCSCYPELFFENPENNLEIKSFPELYSIDEFVENTSVGINQYNLYRTYNFDDGPVEMLIYNCLTAPSDYGFVLRK
tara:strand:+ start:944 stop:1564 length:621 start_codon:yes stop_codon:yes gene_type:complete